MSPPHYAHFLPLLWARHLSRSATVFSEKAFRASISVSTAEETEAQMARLLIMVWGEGWSWGRLGPQTPCSSSDPCPSKDAKMSPLRSQATMWAGADISALPCHGLSPWGLVTGGGGSDGPDTLPYCLWSQAEGSAGRHPQAPRVSLGSRSSDQQSQRSVRGLSASLHAGC